MSRKMVSGVVAVLVLCAPLGVMAQEREVGARAEASVLESLGSLWSGLAAWLAGQIAPSQPESFVDGRCAVDPNGCPGGE
jgi:hypothetical protein